MDTDETQIKTDDGGLKMEDGKTFKIQHSTPNIEDTGHHPFVSEFLERVEAAIRTRHLLSPGQKILVAVSGGADSMVLLHALHRLSARHGWKIFVAHFNHRLRGNASAADERLVRQTAKKLRAQFVGGSADVKQAAARAKISIEMAARTLRHEFLAGAARQHGISTVALAHHAGDQVELFFLRLLRGAGGGGLAGMKWRSPSPVDAKLALIRPLLDFSKADLLAFAKSEKIPFREDATNASNDFFRNRIRNEFLPLLRKKYQPGLDKVILRLMDNLGAESEFVAAAARDFCRGTPPSERVSARAGFDSLPVAVQRKALQQQLTGMGLDSDFELVEQLRKSPNSGISVSVGMTVCRDEGGKLHCRQAISPRFQPGELRVDCSGAAGAVKFGGETFYWRIKPAGAPSAKPPRQKSSPMQSEYFDADKIGGKIILRHWRPGDRFHPIGMKAGVKLQDLFVNAKIPAARRRELVLACTEAGEIFWVQGLRIGEPFKLTHQTRRRLQWRHVPP